MIGKDEIENRTLFHAGTDTTKPMHAHVRALFNELMQKLDVLLPDGRAKSVAFTDLETAEMWANKAIAMLAPVVRE